MPGTRVSVRRLWDLHRQALELDVLTGGAVQALFPGAWRSRFRGRGIEFDEVRPYQWGDDFRIVDWKVTARTGQMHTKLFQEERERTLWLVLDAGPSMQFGTRNCFKWVRAAETAALFAWLARDQGDRIGVVVHGDARRCHVLPGSGGDLGLSRCFGLLAGVHERAASPRCGPARALGHLRRLARPGSLMLIIGDFQGLDTAVERHLAHLSRHGELAAVQVFDPLERELPEAGRYPVTDGNGGCAGVLDTSDPALRRQWGLRFREHSGRVAGTFSRLEARVVRVGTDESLLEPLRNQLRGRAA